MSVSRYSGNDLNPSVKENLQDSFFDIVPNEIIIYIFGFLPLPALGQTMKVCKRWKTISSDESVWKAICHANRQIKKTHPTWREHAIATMPYIYAFAKGGILKRLPKKISDENTFSTKPFLKYTTTYSYGSDIVYVYDSHEKPLFELKHSCCLRSSQIFDERLLSQDEKGSVHIWDLPTQTCFLSYQFLLDRRLFLKENLVFSLQFHPKQQETKIEVHYIQEQLRNFAFIIKGEVSCLDLQGNVLALNAVVEHTTQVIHLIDLQEKQFSSYPDDVPCYGLSKKFSMSWVGYRLHVQKRDPEDGYSVISEMWDFADQTAQKVPQPLEMCCSEPQV